MRRFLSETPVFKELKKQNQLDKFPLKQVIKNHKKGVALSMFITWVLTACVMVMTLVMPNHVKSIIGIEGTTNTILQMSGVLMMLVGLVVSGALADNFKPSSVCKFFAIGLFVSCFAYFYELYIGKNLVIICVSYLLSCLFTGIVNFAPIFMCEVYKPNVRFSGLSFGYNVAYAFAGSITPNLVYFLHTKAIDVGGAWSLGAGAYMCVIAIIAYICAIAFDKIKLTNDF